MISKFKRMASEVTLPIVIALSLSHCANDLLQSVIAAIYPMLKTDLSLTFAQIGLVTLVYQMSASVFQPIVGLLFDKRPTPWSLPFGMCFTTIGLLSLAFANSLPLVFISVFLVGIGSSVLHPEASRITSLASNGRRGLAQSIFQVGGNLGGSVGPLIVALIVAPYGRERIIFFGIISLLAFVIMRPICKWYGNYLHQIRIAKTTSENHKDRPFSARKTIFAISILLVLIFSKYIYMASITSYYTFYLIEKFGVSIQTSQLCLFVFLIATAIGTLIGGPIGDKKGRKFVIWLSILGAAPFSLLMPHMGFAATIVLSFCVGFILSSAFPSILLYAQELLPNKIGLISGLFFGFAFGMGGIASALLGTYADQYGIEMVYKVCAYMPLLGLVAYFLPDTKR